MKTQTQTKPLSTVVQQELKTLKKAINDGHEAIELIVAKTKEKANEALTEAILEGERLAKVKKLLPYGAFTRWLKENCKKISVRTAQRYMTLATRKAQLLKTDIGLRKAYAMIGIIKEDVSDDLDTVTVVGGSAMGKTLTNVNHHILASKAAEKARSINAPKPIIQKDDLMSRAKFLALELTNELTSKINNELIDKADARKILEPLTQLVA